MTPLLRTWAHALGGVVAGGRQVLCPGPGHSPGDRSLSVTPAPHDVDGFIVHSHAGDDWRACRDHVRDRLGLPSSYPQPRPTRVVRPAHAPSDDRTARARALWEEAKDPYGTLVERYLAGRRLHLPDDVAGSVVRFHPACPWRDDATQEVIRVPAMLTPFRSIADARIITAVHRTALSPEGVKVGRRMLGPVAGAAIMVDASENVCQGLFIAEGFETALSSRQLGWRPVWALGSANAIAAFPVLAGIDCLTVLAEFDDNGVNAQAIKMVGKRWVYAGRQVETLVPRFGGDANDALRSAAA